MLVVPWELVEFIESIPAMVENCRSRTVATVVAMVSGLAPGRPADTVRVGKSTRGRLSTGSWRKPIMPATIKDSVINVVITGR